MKTFSAPWSGTLKALSVPISVICLSIVITGLVHGGPGASAREILFFDVLPFAVMAGGVCCTIRGYALTPEEILIKRLFWYTRLPRAGLESAAFSPESVRGSIRMFGNGGFFSFTGWFWSRELGKYRAFATDYSRIVVLRYPRRTIVISPGEPDEFVRAVMGE